MSIPIRISKGFSSIYFVVRFDLIQPNSITLEIQKSHFLLHNKHQQSQQHSATTKYAYIFYDSVKISVIKIALSYQSFPSYSIYRYYY